MPTKLYLMRVYLSCWLERSCNLNSYNCKVRDAWQKNMFWFVGRLLGSSIISILIIIRWCAKKRLTKPKGVIRSRTPKKDRQWSMQRRTKGQTVVNAKTDKRTDSGQCKDVQKDRQWSMQRLTKWQTVVNAKTDKRTDSGQCKGQKDKQR